MKLGSLFDGISGFPLAAQRVGIIPVWASEIEPFPIKVSSIRFPNMKQLGDIAKINGAEIEPVDIITFGSPCQDLSVAGKREGLNGKRSGLFRHAIRIIREMRSATNGKYPRFAVWENVPGAFSSNRGYDFKTVLEEITETKIPIPKSGRWANAGMVRGNGYSLAWRVLDAQYWGVPQRRRRIFLVADFGGQSAPEILFEPESVCGYLAESAATREGTTRNVEGGVGESEGCLTPWDVQSRRIHLVDGKWPALYGGEGGGHGYVFMPPIGFKANVSIADNAPAIAEGTSPFQTTSQMAVAFGVGGSSEVAYCLRSRASKADKHESTTYVVHPQITGTQCASGAGMSRPAGMASETDLVICQPIPINDKATRYKGGGDTRNNDGAGNGLGVGKPGDPCPTLTSADRHAIAHSIDCRNLYENEEISGTLQCKSTGGYSLNYQNPIRIGYAVRRLTPLECERLQGFPDGWTDIPGASDTARYKALGNSVAIPCVQFIMGRIIELTKN